MFHNQPFIASPGFDISIFQLFFPLLSGGTSEFFTKEEVIDIPSFVHQLTHQTVLDTVPAVYSLLLDEIIKNKMQDQFRHLKMIFIGGDVIPDQLLKDLSATFPTTDIVVTYGPTEGTIFCTSIIYKAQEAITEFTGSIIGKPIPGARIYILGGKQELLPLGNEGEIYISGPGTAKGYQNQPALSKEKFLTDPFAPGLVMYRTGDYGRWLNNGCIEFLGRKDQQVKINGRRIEFGEIANTIDRYDGVRFSLVKLHPENDTSLIAYVQADTPIEEKDLRLFLKSRLPAFMCPSQIIMIDQIPLSKNGKVDWKALPKVGTSSPLNDISRIAPVTERERDLVSIWQELLGNQEIGINDNFFEVGGSSLKIVQLSALVTPILGKKISIPELFQYPTITELLEYVDEETNEHLEEADQDTVLAGLSLFNSEEP